MVGPKTPGPAQGWPSRTGCVQVKGFGHNIIAELQGERKTGKDVGHGVTLLPLDHKGAEDEVSSITRPYSQSH